MPECAFRSPSCRSESPPHNWGLAPHVRGQAPLVRVRAIARNAEGVAPGGSHPLSALTSGRGARVNVRFMQLRGRICRDAPKRRKVPENAPASGAPTAAGA